MKKCPQCNTLMYKRANKAQSLFYRCGKCGLHLRRMNPINREEEDILQFINELDIQLAKEAYHMRNLT